MHPSLRFLSLLSAILALSGCSYVQNSEMFRNRTYDYTEQNITNLPTLQTPSNLATPPFSPQFNIPPGPNDYPAGNPPTMTPPGFNDLVPIPPLPPKTKAANS